MASIQYNIPNDAENSFPHLTNFKAIKGKGSKLHNSSSTFKIGLKDTSRSFGDISNRIDRSVPQKASTLTKDKIILKDKIKSKEPSHKQSFNSPFPEPDFRPDIVETEDYGDILPDDCVLTKEKITRFSRFGKGQRFFSVEERPPSPSPLLNLLPLKKCDTRASSFELLPVEDDFDIFNLPYPLMLN